MDKNPKTMKAKGTNISSKKRTTRDALDELMDDMVRWKYNHLASKKSLVEMLRGKYIIKRK